MSGDEVIVAPGTYNETINFNGKAIELASSHGAAVTIIDGTGQGGTVVLCNSGEPPETILRGFTVTGGNAYGSGGGMLISDSSPTVLECVFLKNYVFTYHPACVSCGGGMLIVRGSPTVVNCQFIGNVADKSLTCDGDGGGICIKDGSPVVTGCTFTANRASFGRGGAIYNVGGNLTVSNCILWGNTPDEISSDSSTSSVTFSDVQGGFPGVGNIDADPLFVDPDGADDIPGTMDDNLLLRWGSPAIDAGDNKAVPPDVADLDGDNNTAEPTPLDLDRNPRFVDDSKTPDTGNGTPPIVDMGAFEFQRHAIPTLPQWGLAALTLGLLTVGCLLFRRRRVDSSLPDPGRPEQCGLRALGALLGVLAWTSVASAQVDVGDQDCSADAAVYLGGLLGARHRRTDQHNGTPSGCRRILDRSH